MKQHKHPFASCFLSLFALLVIVMIHSPPASAFETWESRIVEGHGGVPLVVHEWGDPNGIPILMIHGMSFGASAFKYQSGPGLEGLRFIAPDLRGHGMSAKPWVPEAYADTKIWADDIEAVKTAFGLTYPIIVNWSFGGYVTMNYLRHCEGDCAAGIMFVGTLAGLVANPTFEERPDFGLPPPRGDSRQDNYASLFDSLDWVTRVMSFAPPSDRDKKDKLLTTAMMSPIVRRALRGIPLDNQDIVDKLTMPVLLVHGEKDPSVPAAFIERVIEKLPDADNLLFKGVGHSPFEEDAARFNETLRGFAFEVNQRRR